MSEIALQFHFEFSIRKGSLTWESVSPHLNEKKDTADRDYLTETVHF